MRAYVFDGTPEEVVQAVTAMKGFMPDATILPVAPVVAPVAPKEISEGGEKRAFLSTEVARKVISRRPLSDAQRKVLRLLAGNSPEFTSLNLIQRATNYTPAQVAGLLGALGRRVSGTPGYVENTTLLDWRWDNAAQCWAYRMPPSVVEAAKLEKLI